MHDIIVVGGGIVGASVAYHAAKSGAKVALVENESTGRATSAGAGIISPGTSLRPLPAFFAFAKPAVTYYPHLVADLAELDAGDTGYAVTGQLFLAETEDELDQLAGAKSLFEQRLADGMPHIESVTRVDAAEAKRRFPALADVAGALFIAGAARVDGALLREALTTAAVRLGAERIVGAASLTMDGSRVSGVDVAGERYPAERVLVSTGCWSNAVLEPSGFQLPMAPQKGQILHYDLEGTDTSTWPILTWFGDQYILTFGPNRVVAGATREFGSGYDTRVTPAGLKHVIDTSLRIAPGLADSTLAEVRVGLRPYSDDGLPLIGLVPGHDNLFVCTGHGPSGLQLGPYSGKIAADIALGHPVGEDMTPFAPDRPIVPAGH